MKYINWIKENCSDLKGKLVAITGASGDLGKEVCLYLASLGANLLFINRNKDKSNKLKQEILNKFPNIDINEIIVDLESFYDVKNILDEVDKYSIDILILNAGAYKIERKISDIGYDNVFQINFVSQYYLAKKIIEKMESKGEGKVVVVSSIANNYSKININDIDFKECNKCSKVYGNSKRFLMYSFYELFKEKENIKLSVVHPGISYTNITSHYPKLVFKIIKYPMKIIFSKPNKASLSIIKGVFDDCNYHYWIGPKYFNIWGYPKKRKITSCSINESEIIYKESENIFNKL